MTRLTDTLYRSALAHKIIIGFVSAFLAFVSAYGTAKLEIKSLRDATETKIEAIKTSAEAEVDWIESQLKEEAARQQNQISALRGTVQTMRDQQSGMDQLKWQIERIQSDVAEIKEALGLRLRPGRDGGP